MHLLYFGHRRSQNKLASLTSARTRGAFLEVQDGVVCRAAVIGSRSSF